MRVFKGEAAFQEKSGDGQKLLKIKGDHQVGLVANASMVSVSFDRNQAEDALYQWSSLRSQYLAEANIDMASAYAGYGGVGPGWYWNAGLWGYTWLPGDGLWWSPFGWGFYSPRYIYFGGPVFYRGYHGRGYVQTRGYAGSFHGGGFSGGAVARHGRRFPRRPWPKQDQPKSGQKPVLSGRAFVFPAIPPVVAPVRVY